MARYMIWEGFMDAVNAKMKTIQKKCQKYGVEFTFRETGNVEYREYDYKHDNGYFEKIKLRYVEVEAEGKAQINGWEWLARVEHTEKGNIIHSARDVDIPNEYYTSDCYCEHCKKDVWRKNLHLVRNIETGEIKQVGQNCLKDFTNGMSAERVAWLQSLFTGLEKEEVREPSCGLGGFGNREYYDAEEVVRFMAETIRHFGFVPKNEDGKTTTVQRTQNYYDVAHGRMSKFSLCPDVFYKIKDEMNRIGFNAESEQATKEAHEALEWIAVQDDTHSAYIHNLKIVCSMEQVNSWHFGILASLIPTWNKSLVREAQRKAEQSAEQHSEYIGKIGERITFNVASTKIVTSWETDYGMVHLVKFVSVDGNVFMWKSSSVHNLPDDFELIESITGTVKDHTEFRDVKQTFITRCKIKERTIKKEEPHHAPYNDEAEKALEQFLNDLE